MSENFDFDHAVGTMTGDEQQAADDKLIVQFFTQPVLDDLLTNGGLVPVRHPRVAELKERGIELKPYVKQFPTEGDHWVVEPAGRPIYTNIEWVRIIAPGNRNNIIERPLDEVDRKRFAKRYSNWKTRSDTAALVGTPLSEVPFVDAARRQELAFFNIHTAEQLVELPETVAQQFMGMHTLQARVKHWLEGTSGNAHIEKLAQEAKAKDAEISAQREAIRKLQEQVAQLAAAQDTKKGK